MQSYYKARAPIYDRVYAYPERQEDLRFLEKYIPEQFVGLDVLEIAAGTGYWTQFIAETANSIHATDAVGETLKFIQLRSISKPVVTTVTDAYSLMEVATTFTGVFAGLWLSHVPKQRLSEFFDVLRQKLQPGARALFIDNSIAQCKRLPLTYTDEFGNTYQDRPLEDGSTHRVIKNFPTESEIKSVTSDFAINCKYISLENFWLFQCDV